MAYATVLATFENSALYQVYLGPVNLYLARILLFLMCVLMFIRLEDFWQSVFSLRSRIPTHVAFLFCWLGYGILSITWAVSLETAIRHILFLMAGMAMVCIIVFYFPTYSQLVRLGYCWIGAMVILGVLGIWEVSTGRHLTTSGMTDMENQHRMHGERERFLYRPTATFYNSNDYATFLSLSIPFVLLLFSRRDCHSKGLGLVVLALFAFLLLKGESRANYLAVLLEAAFWWFFLSNRQHKFGFVACAGLMALATMLLFSADARQFLETAHNRLLSVADLTSDSDLNRSQVYWSTLSSISETYGLGLGPGNTEQYLEDCASATAGVTNAHNWWLQILAEYGVGVFFAYVVFYLSLLHSLCGIVRRSQDRQEQALAGALAVSLVGFSVASISSSSLVGCLPLWAFFGFALAVVNAHRTQLGRSMPCTY